MVINSRKRIEVDIWDGVLQQRIREYRAMGLSFDQAEERATAVVCREIRGEHTLYNARWYPL